MWKQISARFFVFLTFSLPFLINWCVHLTTQSKITGFIIMSVTILHLQVKQIYSFSVFGKYTQNSYWSICSLLPLHFPKKVRQQWYFLKFSLWNLKSRNKIIILSPFHFLFPFVLPKFFTCFPLTSQDSLPLASRHPFIQLLFWKLN